MLWTVAKAELAADEVLEIRKARYGNGGERVSIVTGIHGDELEGQYTTFLVGQTLRAHPDLLKGTVDIYPALNPFGIDAVVRGIPAFDLDMNRIFPGRADGDMNEYIASEIIRDVSGSSLVLDIHASNKFLTEVPQIRINQLHREALLPFAEESNMDFVWVHQSATVLESTFAYSLNSTGTRTLVVEMGVGMRITKRYGEQLADGILHLLSKLGIWKGTNPIVKRPIISTDPSEVCYLNAPCAGIYLKDRPVGSHVVAGEAVGRLIDPLHTATLCEICAPAAGWLFTTREYPVCEEGSLLGRILQKPEGGSRR